MINVAGVEFSYAVLATWGSEHETWSVHTDRNALMSAYSPLGPPIVEARMIMVDQTEWNAVPLFFGSASVSIEGDHYTVLIDGEPSVYSGHIVSYGAFI